MASNVVSVRVGVRTSDRMTAHLWWRFGPALLLSFVAIAAVASAGGLVAQGAAAVASACAGIAGFLAGSGLEEDRVMRRDGRRSGHPYP